MKVTYTLDNPLWSTPTRKALLDQEVQQSAAELQRLIQETMLSETRKEQPSGKTYRRKAITKPVPKRNIPPGLRRQRGNPNRVVVGYEFHRASARGQAPAVDSGDLVESIRAGRTGEMKARVTAGKNYAPILDDPERLGRPFFETTAEAYKEKFKQNIITVIENNGIR